MTGLDSSGFPFQRMESRLSAGQRALQIEASGACSFPTSRTALASVRGAGSGECQGCDEEDIRSQMQLHGSSSGKWLSSAGHEHFVVM